jgi:ferredoxin
MSRRFAVHVDRNLCVGNAMCRAVAPDAFTPDEQGQSVAADPFPEPLETALEAAAGCPVGAIRVEDLDTGEEIDF